jgi:hypothetical protein
MHSLLKVHRPWWFGHDSNSRAIEGCLKTTAHHGFSLQMQADDQPWFISGAIVP